MAARIVKVVNNSNTDLGIQCNDGTLYLHMTQFIQGKTTHISKPVDYSNLPDPVVKKGGMIARKEVSIIDV
jgi:hypothetical protein